YRDPAPVNGEDAVDQRYHVAPAIRRRQINRTSVETARDRRFGGPLRIDPITECAGVLLGKEPVDGYVDEVGVSVVRVQIGVGELLRLDHEMPVVGAGGAQPGEVDAVDGRAHLEDVQHLERGEALSGRGELKDVVTVVIRGYGLHPFRFELGEVLFRHHAAARLDLGDDGVRDLAPVKDVRTLALQQPQGAGEVRITNQ